MLCSCKEPMHIPRANKAEFVKDSFYFHRDTLNFHHVVLPDYILNSVDTIVQNHALKPNYYWDITIRKDRHGIIFEISSIYCEKFMLYLDNTNEPYKASIINGQRVFIYDEEDLLPIDFGLPYIRIYNPGKMTAFYKTSSSSWTFQRNIKGRVILINHE